MTILDLPVRQSIRLSKAAAILDVHTDHLRKIIQSEGIPSHRIGKRGVRVYLDDIIAYRDRGTVTRPTAKPEKRVNLNGAVSYLRRVGAL
jgi:excisionase family DNA binding protein